MVSHKDSRMCSVFWDFGIEGQGVFFGVFLFGCQERTTDVEKFGMISIIDVDVTISGT